MVGEIQTPFLILLAFEAGWSGLGEAPQPAEQEGDPRAHHFCHPCQSAERDWAGETWAWVYGFFDRLPKFRLFEIERSTA